jgi:hypothetical protein
MIQVECVVGRLVEVRTMSPFTMDEIAAFTVSFMKILKAARGRVVPCTDLRGSLVASPEQSEAFSAMFRRDNPMLERSGILLPAGQATLGLQLERMVREAGNPARRTFREVAPLCAFLDEVLDREEQARLRVFLGPER